MSMDNIHLILQSLGVFTGTSLGYFILFLLVRFILKTFDIDFEKVVEK